MGKKLPDYVANKVADVSVVIVNASKTKMTERRKNETLHERYSGQPGGFKTETNAKIIDKKGWEGLYELAVYGMLPANKLRPLMMKRLTIKD
jgi:large subunit ribosomal protein L13